MPTKDHRSPKWRARVKYKMCDVYLGLFDTEEEAQEAEDAFRRDRAMEKERDERMTG